MADSQKIELEVTVIIRLNRLASYNNKKHKDLTIFMLNIIYDII